MAQTAGLNVWTPGKDLMAKYKCKCEYKKQLTIIDNNNTVIDNNNFKSFVWFNIFKLSMSTKS